MKQFSLEEYLKNPQREIVTRDGLPVRIICTDKMCNNRGNQKPVIALVNFGDREVVYPYSSDGISAPELPKYDLFFGLKKKEGWINIYKYNSGITPGSLIYNTKEEAESAKGSGLMDYISTIKIQWEE